MKPKLALYWAASCGGCDLAVLEIGPHILEVAEAADIVFWPCLMDFKLEHVRALDDRAIDVCLFNGAVRTSEQAEVARLLRVKSKTMVAYGSCAHEGCIPALANLTTRDEIFEVAYRKSPSTDNPASVTPRTRTAPAGCELSLPEFWDTVAALDQVVEVDYTVPGCPPTEKTTWAALQALLSPMPPQRGSVLGAGSKTVCDECPYEKSETSIAAFHRPHLIARDPDSRQCLLERGLVCLGPATRSGCEARCLDAGQGCRGCYGPAGEVHDQGAKMVAMLGGLVAEGSEEEIRAIMDQIVDPVGTFYRFGLARSELRRRKKDNR